MLSHNFSNVADRRLNSGRPKPSPRLVPESLHRQKPVPGVPLFLQPKQTISQPGNPYEQEADRVADQAMQIPNTVEPRFGQDLSPVRVHTDGDAQQSARDVNALAYTVGSHVVFGAGQYDPGTSGGQGLLTHEPAHVAHLGQADSPSQIQRYAEEETAGVQETIEETSILSVGGMEEGDELKEA